MPHVFIDSMTLTINLSPVTAKLAILIAGNKHKFIARDKDIGD
jgi:hypothetical protein